MYEAMVFKFQVYSVVLSKHQTSHTPLPHISLLLKKSLTTISYIPSTKEYLIHYTILTTILTTEYSNARLKELSSDLLL